MTGSLRMTAVVGLLAATLVACERKEQEGEETKAVVPVATAPASIGTIRAVIYATGVVAPAPGADLAVVAPDAARVAEVPRAEGERVRKGDLLVRFDVPAVAAETRSKLAETSRAGARVVAARATLSRTTDLFARGVGARKDVEEATRELADAEAAAAQAEAARGAADTTAERLTVLAPFDGVVVKRSHNPGDQVASGDAVLRLIDPRRLEVVALVPVRDLPRLRVGAHARIHAAGDTAGDAAGGDAAMTLRVVALPASVDEATGAAAVRLAFSATATPYPVGAPVQVDIAAEEHANVVLVPLDVVVHEGEEAAIFVVEGKKATRRVVGLGISDGTLVELTSGVAAGEPVVIHGQNGLPDDAAVAVTPPK